VRDDCAVHNTTPLQYEFGRKSLVIIVDAIKGYACATASPQGWDISVAPLLVPASRSTTLAQANFVGKVCTRASS
jgi:hypothetical protein